MHTNRTRKWRLLVFGDLQSLQSNLVAANTHVWLLYIYPLWKIILFHFILDREHSAKLQQKITYSPGWQVAGPRWRPRCTSKTFWGNSRYLSFLKIINPFQLHFRPDKFSHTAPKNDLSFFKNVRPWMAPNISVGSLYCYPVWRIVLHYRDCTFFQVTLMYLLAVFFNPVIVIIQEYNTLKP